jgi:hypothetical protein
MPASGKPQSPPQPGRPSDSDERGFFAVAFGFYHSSSTGTTKALKSAKCDDLFLKISAVPVLTLTHNAARAALAPNS